MTNFKKKALLLFFSITIPIILLVNLILFLIMPDKYRLPDSLIEGTTFLWLAKWSSSLSIVIALMVFALIFRILITNKKNEDE